MTLVNLYSKILEILSSKALKIIAIFYFYLFMDRNKFVMILNYLDNDTLSDSVLFSSNISIYFFIFFKHSPKYFTASLSSCWCRGKVIFAEGTLSILIFWVHWRSNSFKFCSLKGWVLCFWGMSLVFNYEKWGILLFLSLWTNKYNYLNLMKCFLSIILDSSKIEK